MSNSKKKYCRKRLVESQYFEATQDENILLQPDFNIIESNKMLEDQQIIKTSTKKKIPQGDEDTITPMKSQYFEVKAQYRNSLILFQRGQFYQAYDDDAIYINQNLGYNWRNIIKRVIGIPEQNLEEDILRLINMNQTVVVCQQTEDAISHQERLKQQKSNGIRSTEKFSIINRKIVGVYQEGVIGLGCLCNKTLGQFKNNYIIAISKFSSSQLVQFGKIDVTILDTINKKTIILVQNINQIQQLFETYPPSLILISKNDLELSNLIQQQQIIRRISVNKSEKSLNIIKEFLLECFFYEDTIPQLSFFFQSGDQLVDKTQIVMAEFFKEFSFRQVSQFTISQVKSFKLKENVLNQLDVFERSKNTRKKNSIFQILNYTVTEIGEELLENWLSNPLIKIQDILNRQNAINDLLKIFSQISVIREEMKQLKDMQRRILWLYGQAQAFYIARSEICYKPFILLKQFLIDTRNILYQISIRILPCKETFTSQLLLNLLDEERIMNTRQTIEEISETIIWIGDNLDIPSPAKTPYKEQFNDLNQSISLVQQKIQFEVIRIREQFSKPNEIVESNSQRYQHEIEIPVSLLGEIHQEMQLEISSVRQGFYLNFFQFFEGFRKYKNPLIRDLNQEEFILQTKLKGLLSEFQKQILTQFIESKQIWNQLMEVISNLDVLFSLTFYSGQVGLTRPIFVEDSFKLEAKNLTHPILRELIHENFISNSFKLDKADFCAIITGCNGSGKSTFMRAIGSCVILAQIGCYVPCSLFTLKAFQQIYVRMGANDNILENRSTFYQELKENSLFLLDELGKNTQIIILGRGTTTSDGQAISYGVLKYFLNKSQNNIILFTTHFLKIVKDMMRDQQKLITFKMGVGEDLKMDFKLQQGVYEQEISPYIISTLKLDEQILQRARKISLFQENFKKQRQFNEIIERVVKN